MKDDLGCPTNDQKVCLYPRALISIGRYTFLVSQSTRYRTHQKIAVAITEPLEGVVE
jgi:hypothetical protein